LTMGFIWGYSRW